MITLTGALWGYQKQARHTPQIMHMALFSFYYN